MSTVFGTAAAIRLSPPARAALADHQWNSWRIILMTPRLIRLWAARRDQRRALGELVTAQHLLDDIGLTRTQALHEAGKPFWRP